MGPHRLISAQLLVAALLVTACAACTCNNVGNTQAARIAPFSLSSPSLGNPILDIAQVTSQLLADESGLPHKMAMVFVTMKEGYAFSKNSTNDNASDSISRAASAGYEVLVRLLKEAPPKLQLLNARMKKLGIERGDENFASIAMKTLMKFKPENMNPYSSPNKPSTTYDATCNSLQEGDKWQPQCVQMKPGSKCMTQKVPFGGLRNASLVSFNGERAVDELLAVLPAAPSYSGSLSDLALDDSNKFAAQYKRVLDTSAALDDLRKFKAEFFRPNAAWLVYNVALNEAIARNITPEETIRLMATVAAATRDAAVASVTTKLRYSSARPLSVIQCAWGALEVPAWRGPYMGVSTGSLAGWRPYLLTPPHPGYVSGHATVSSAGMAVMRKFFGEDLVRGANCAILKEGMSMVEPRIEKGSFGYIEGITDVPNQGVWTKGYSPAKDTKLCWNSFSHFRTMLAESREFGGIHIPADNWMGVQLGERVGYFAGRNL